MRLIFRVMMTVVVALPLLASGGKHNPDTFACSSTPFAYDAFDHKPSVPSPDGKAQIQLEREFTFRVLVSRKEIGKLTYADLSCCIEVGWSPDSSRFFISYSDGGAAGGYHVHVFSIRDSHLVESAAPKAAFDTFKRQHYCQTRGNNLFFLDFTPDSKNGFLVTEVYPTSDCGREMSKFRGYVVNLDSGKVLETYGEKQTTAIEKSCRASGKLQLRAVRAVDPTIVVKQPTVVAFFPPVDTATIDADTNEALSDFQFYAQKVREPLRKAGIDFHEVYVHSFSVRVGDKMTTFHPGKVEIGYYFTAPGKESRVEYGVMTDADLLHVAEEYFGTGAKSSAVTPSQNGTTVPNYCFEVEPLKPNLHVQSTVPVKGRIIDATGAPFEKGQVELRRFISEREQVTLIKVRTDSEGNFDLGTVAKNDYRLLASPTRAFRQPDEMWCGSEGSCFLNITLQANPTDLPESQCPIR